MRELIHADINLNSSGKVNAIISVCTLFLSYLVSPLFKYNILKQFEGL